MLVSSSYICTCTYSTFNTYAAANVSHCSGAIAACVIYSPSNAIFHLHAAPRPRRRRICGGIWSGYTRYHTYTARRNSPGPSDVTVSDGIARHTLAHNNIISRTYIYIYVTSCSCSTPAARNRDSGNRFRAMKMVYTRVREPFCNRSCTRRFVVYNRRGGIAILTESEHIYYTRKHERVLYELYRTTTVIHRI